MSNTVIIACRLRHGLWLEHGYEYPPNGIGPIRYLPNYKKVKLNGANSTIVQTSRFVLPPNLPDELPGITEVDADLWDAWYKANKDLEFVKQGLVKVVEKRGDVKAVSADMRQQPTGIEPLDPNKPPPGLKKGEIQPGNFGES